MLVRRPPMQPPPPPAPPLLPIALCDTLRPMRASLPRLSRARRSRSDVLGLRLLAPLAVEPRRATMSDVDERRMLPPDESPSAVLLEPAAPPPPATCMYGDSR